ncbi:MAG: acyl-homoserine-lactone synthase [Sphingosinicella sp.]|uniref:acyl-homoserine-lactone synthase n=1 Tax=Sphingosinicella sp. TaxID=1917971 RepID=UPI0040378262
MVLVVERARQPLADETLRSMFEARKRVFVDLLKWDVPVLEGRFELDQFDDEQAIYLVVHDDDGGHLGSARLLETVRPHLLDTLFADLCAAPPPCGPNVLEITRFCLARPLAENGRGAGPTPSITFRKGLRRRLQAARTSEANAASASWIFGGGQGSGRRSPVAGWSISAGRRPGDPGSSISIARAVSARRRSASPRSISPAARRTKAGVAAKGRQK